MKPDYINGLFELIGSYFTWMNAYALYRDKIIKTNTKKGKIYS